MDNAIQQKFFQHIKGKLPGHISFVDEIAELLTISNDSAYRRIRAEKPITLGEVTLLCNHYKISIDQFINVDSESFVFSGKINHGLENSFENYMNDLEDNFKFFNSFTEKHLYTLLKDIPPFVHFQIPELAAFKFFFWSKSILHDETLRGVKFDMYDSRYEKFITQGKRIVKLYTKIPNTEIWNIDSINTTLRQINFHYEAGSFINNEDVITIYQKVEELVTHIETQAESGVKFLIGEKPENDASEFRMFINELILGDNTNLAELDGNRLTFLNHSVLYFVHTSDKRFNESMFANLQNLLRKSTAINVVGEKERVRFFNRLRDKISYHKSLIKN